MRNKAFRYGKVRLGGRNNEIFIVSIIANKNKDIEEEKKRALKVAYDKLTQMKYLYEVEKITDKTQLIEMLEKE